MTRSNCRHREASLAPREAARLKPDGRSVLLAVRGGRQTLVDRDVAAALGARRLHRSNGYPSFGRHTLLHHFVVGKPPAGMVTDHINGNRDDNRRCNLRHVTQARNLLNQHVVRGKVPWRGVSQKGSLFTAECVTPARRRHCGNYATALVAAFVRDDVLRAVTGQGDGLNFPQFVRRRDLGGFLRATKGRIFHVMFVRRRDGVLRPMTCRTGVAKHVKGKPLAFDPEEKGLLGVFDLRKGNYRYIPLENVLCVTYRGKRFRVVP